MIYYIGNIEFKSKKSAEDYTRQLINTIGVNQCINKSHDSFTFLIDLLDNHHKKNEKIGCGIDYFIIRKNDRGTGFEVQIKRVDGSIESFSWRDCATNTFKNNTQLLDVAMRHAVDSQIKEFRFNNPLEICNICKNTCKCAVDHSCPTFNEIKMGFLKINTITIPIDFDKECGTNQQRFKKTDYDFELSWYNYHKNYSILQYLCTSCHKTKTSNDIKLIRRHD